MQQLDNAFNEVIKLMRMKDFLRRIIKNYKFGFSLTALIFYLGQLLPNIVWMLCPPANDILAENSSPYIIIDISEQLFGTLMMFTLVFVVRKDRTTNNICFFVLAGAALLVYYICWTLYYNGITDPYMFIIGMAVMPVVAFGAFGVWRKNYFMLFPDVIFAVFHLIITCGTFL